MNTAITRTQVRKTETPRIIAAVMFISKEFPGEWISSPLR
jgi:hypothetical protein